MEPQRNEPETPNMTPEQEKKQKSHFQIVKLEERIAPKTGGSGHHHTGVRCRYSTATSY